MDLGTDGCQVAHGTLVLIIALCRPSNPEQHRHHEYREQERA